MVVVNEEDDDESGGQGGEAERDRLGLRHAESVCLFDPATAMVSQWAILLPAMVTSHPF